MQPLASMVKKLVPLDHGEALAISRGGHIQPVTSLEAKLLAQFTGIKSLEEHLEAAWRSGVCADQSAVAACVARLLRVSLIGPVDISRCSALKSQAKPDGPIAVVAIVTADRPISLRGTLESLDAHCVAHGRTPRVLVIDGSGEAGAIAETFKVVAHQQFNSIRAEYVGAAETGRLRRYLETCDLSPTIINAFTTPGSIGCGRNVAVLMADASRVLMMDDDIVCRPWALPDAEEGFELGGHSDPRVWELFGSRDDAVRELHSMSTDLLMEHGRLMDQSLLALGLHPEQCQATNACSHLLDVMGSPRARVRVTFAGLAGDSARHCPGRLLFEQGDVRRTLLGDERQFDLALTSREVRRIVKRDTLTHDPRCMSYFMGLGLDGCVPPFMYVGRNEDGLFGAMLAACDQWALFGHSRIGVVHHSHRQAKYNSSEYVSATSARLSDILGPLLGIGARTLVGDDGEERLYRLGSYFRDLARTSDAECEGRVRECIVAAKCGEIAAADAEISRNGYPQYWRLEFDRYCRLLKASMAKRAFFVPVELAHVPDEMVWKTMRELFGLLGEGMQVWRDIRAAAAGYCSRIADVKRPVMSGGLVRSAEIS